MDYTNFESFQTPLRVPRTVQMEDIHGASPHPSSPPSAGGRFDALAAAAITPTPRRTPTTSTTTTTQHHTMLNASSVNNNHNNNNNQYGSVNFSSMNVTPARRVVDPSSSLEASGRKVGWASEPRAPMQQQDMMNRSSCYLRSGSGINTSAAFHSNSGAEGYKSVSCGLTSAATPSAPRAGTTSSTRTAVSLGGGRGESTATAAAAAAGCGNSPDGDRRRKQRGKQVTFGYVTAGYKNMVRLIEHDPVLRSGGILPLSPPDVVKGSKRTWDIQLRKWRRALHMFDYVFIDGEDEEEQRAVVAEEQRKQWVSAAFADTPREGRVRHSMEALMAARNSPMVPTTIPVEEDLVCILRDASCYESVRSVVPQGVSSLTKGTDISPLEAGIKIHIAPSTAVLQRQREQHELRLQADAAAREVSPQRPIASATTAAMLLGSPAPVQPPGLTLSRRLQSSVSASSPAPVAQRLAFASVAAPSPSMRQHSSAAAAGQTLSASPSPARPLEAPTYSVPPPYIPGGGSTSTQRGGMWGECSVQQPQIPMMVPAYPPLYSSGAAGTSAPGLSSMMSNAMHWDPTAAAAAMAHAGNPTATSSFGMSFAPPPPPPPFMMTAHQNAAMMSSSTPSMPRGSTHAQGGSRGYNGSASPSHSMQQPATAPRYVAMLQSSPSEPRLHELREASLAAQAAAAAALASARLADDDDADDVFPMATPSRSPATNTGYAATPYGVIQPMEAQGSSSNNACEAAMIGSPQRVLFAGAGGEDCPTAVKYVPDGDDNGGCPMEEESSSSLMLGVEKLMHTVGIESADDDEASTTQRNIYI